jgi:hypothetical protein
MRLKWGHLCSRADFDNGIWSLHELADGYPVSPQGKVVLHDPTQLALLFHAHANEPQIQRFQMIVTDSSGKPYSDLGGDEVHFVNVGDALPRVGPKRITLQQVWNFPGNVGDLSFDISDGEGRRLGRIPLPVFPEKTFAPQRAPVPAGKKIPKRPFRLAWAHLAERFEINPETHTLTLHKVFDHGQLLPNLDFLLVDPACLALQIIGDAAVGPDHLLSIRPVDEDGKPLSWALERQIEFVQHKRGASPQAAQIFDLSGQLLIGGTIEFKVYVGGKYVDSFTLDIQKLKPEDLRENG